MRFYKNLIPLISCCFVVVAHAQNEAASYAEAMAKTVMRRWKDSLAHTWSYDQGVVYGGLEALWKNTGNADYFNYIKKNIDYYVLPEGDIKTYKKESYNLDNLKCGNALLLMYNVTGEEKYFKAATVLRQQLREQPRTQSGGFWHKQIYPYQMWLDGLYMAEPFYAAYAKRVHDDTAFNDIARQFILSETHMRDAKRGLLYHGWDESKQQAWANKKNGTSPNFWGRAMGWFGMALVDVLDCFPDSNSHKQELIQILNRYAKAVVKVQDLSTGLWWDVLNFPNRKGNYFEASASCMFVYTLAKAVRQGYLPHAYLPAAEKGYHGILQHFIKKNNDGSIDLNGTVSVSGLGGKPYRDGSYEYYLKEKVITNDLKGIGAFIQMCVEMDMVSTRISGEGRSILLDAYFNHELKYDPASHDTVPYHYIWNEEDNNGYSMLGNVFEKFGVRNRLLTHAVTREDLQKVSMYMIVDPDIPKETKTPHYIEREQVNTIADWVKGGGTLLLLNNDSGNAEFTHLNNLAETFGIHFNEDSYNRVKGLNFSMGTIPVSAGNLIFSPKKIYIKELATLRVSAPAQAVLTHEGHIIMAVSRFGKGIVFAVGDPWLYNEYLNGRKLPADLQNYGAAEELVRWLLQQ